MRSQTFFSKMGGKEGDSLSLNIDHNDLPKYLHSSAIPVNSISVRWTPNNIFYRF